MPDGNARAYTHPELENLAALIANKKDGEKELAQIATDCMEAYKEDLSSRTEWDRMHADWVTQFYKKDKAKNPPWPGSSEESLPLLAEACIQYAARAKQALFPGRDFVKAMPAGKTDAGSKDRAERVQNHLGWQCTVLNRRNYKRNKFRLLLGHALHGSYFTKSFWDPQKGRWVVENVRATDLVVPYGNGPRDIADVDRKTQHIWMSKNKGAIAAKNGYFISAPSPYTLDEAT